MPISDPDGYDDGHFKRVYKHIIKPACTAAGLQAKRADEVKNTNYIVIDILKRIIDSDIVICDLSSKNPNVLYELGIRQAFNLPSTLIKDNKTERIFDIQGIRTIDYDGSLRIDSVQKDIISIKTTLEETLENIGKDVNSLIQLLGIHPAELGKRTEISNETSLILDALRDVSQRITRIEDVEKTIGSGKEPTLGKMLEHALAEHKELEKLPNGIMISSGEPVYASPGGDFLGFYAGQGVVGIMLHKEDGAHHFIRPDNPLYKTLTGPDFG